MNHTSSSSYPKPRARRRNQAQWQALMDQYAQSDLTIEQFCQEHRITVSSFYAWRRRLTPTAQMDESGPALIDITSPPKESGAMPSAASPWQVELELGPGCVLRIKTA